MLYTGGTLPELIDVIIEEKASLFICAVGVPPKWAVDKLHAAKIPGLAVNSVRAFMNTCSRSLFAIPIQI